MKTIGLCMIVKNESEVILRCLESARPIVDYVLIEDTGSTDGTQKIIREWLDHVGLPGEVYNEPWRDFAYNRSHALARLRENERVDYALVLDADDHIVFEPDFDVAAFKNGLSLDLYDVEMRNGPIRYRRGQICSNRRAFRYRGVLHEFIEGPPNADTSGNATGFYVVSTRDGARGQDPNKHYKDAEVLKKALETERDPLLRSRYIFYLARSYQYAGESEQALETFLKRAELGHWSEEVFISLYSAGQLQHALGYPLKEVIDTYLRASDAAPSRAEALHAASRLCRENNKHAEGYEHARRGLAMSVPDHGLFVEPWIYEYGLLDELAVNAYWTGRYQDCLDACQRLLRDGKFPDDMRERITKNLEFARVKLASPSRATSELGRIGTKSQANEHETERAPLKVILICGPWGSGTSAVAGLLERMGAFGLGPYFVTSDPETTSSYESVPFREIILRYASQPTLSLIPFVPGAVQSDLRSLQRRVEQQEFGSYDLRSPKPIFLKYPLSALLIPQICEVFDTKLIYVMRPLEEIERTRLRRNWLPYFGAEGAAVIYDYMSAALKQHAHPTLTLNYKDLLADPMVHARNIARFVNLNPNSTELRHAVDFVRTSRAIPSRRALTNTSQGVDAKKEDVKTASTEKRYESNSLHVLGVAHTIPHEDYLVCAFTAKVLLFPEVIQPFGWDVIEYSNEGSASKAREHVVILTKDRLRALSRRRSREEPLDADVDNIDLSGEFQRVLLEKIRSRAKPGDIVCHVWGPNMEVYNLLRDCHHIELCVGYTASPGLPFRIYESSAWMHWHYGKAGQEDGSHYKWVIPSPIDVERWVFCEQPDDYAIFLGRVASRKGMNEIVEIARRMPELPIHVYGPGDPSQWAKEALANLVFKGPIFGDERVDVVRRARCMLMPTVFIEPFGNSGIEAQLSGVPLIASSYGAFQETILEGVTGYRCHTLADWVEAIRLSRSLDRRQIATLARGKYSKEVAGKKYDWALRQLADLSGRGWYGDKSRKFAGAAVLPQKETLRKPRIWLYMPYFGAFPNYFQLYLDSLGKNADCLSVFLMTDNDLSGYRLPDNLIPIQLTLGALREKAARLINDEFGMNVQPDALLKQAYKLCDLKIMYPELFRDISKQYGVTDDDFVGWGDCDLIYGRFSDFLDMKEDYQIIGGFHGHFTAVRNTDSFRKLFKAVEDLPRLLLDETSLAVDEIAFRKPLQDFLERNAYRMFYINRYFCDIVPECFFGRFRQDHAQRNKNYFDAYRPDKDIDHIYYDRGGRLTVVYDDGDSRASIYCHLQKRIMSMDFDVYEHGYYIREDGFSLAPPADDPRSPGLTPGPDALRSVSTTDAPDLRKAADVASLSLTKPAI